MRCIFLGTSEFAVPTLEALMHSEHRIDLVVTQPDRPKGRGRKLAASPIKTLALKNGLNVYQPVSLDSGARIEIAQALLDAGVANGVPDVGVTVAYGLLVPEWLLELPEHGLINVHPSDVPKFRGAAPIQRTLMAGDSRTSVCVLRMGQGLDDGPVYARDVVDIAEDDDFGSLSDKCATLGGRMVIRVLAQFDAGTAVAIDQAENGEIYANKILPADREIDWTQTSRLVHGRVRGLAPRPGAFTFVQGKSVKVLKTVIVETDSKLSPGVVVDSNPDDFRVQTGDGAVRIEEVQPEGRSRMTVQDYLRGTKIDMGLVLGE